MDALSILSAAPLDALKPPAVAPTAAAGATADKLKSTAQKFESSFLSVMLGAMFEGVSTAAPFGGGAGEEAFRSFLTEEMAKGITKHGGVGLSPVIQREMMRMQGAHT